MTVTPFAHALILGLWTNAVLIVPVAIIIGLVVRWLRRPELAHTLWLLVLIKLLMPPLITPSLSIDTAKWPLFAAVLANPNANLANDDGSAIGSLSKLRVVESHYDEHLRNPSEKKALEGLVSGVLIPRVNGAETDFLAHRLNLPLGWAGSIISILVTCWLVGSVFFFFAILLRTYRLVALVQSRGRRCPLSTKRIAELLGRCRRRPPIVLIVDAVMPPTLVGIGKWTKILLPKLLWQDLNGEQRDSLLTHEIEHFRRCDHWVRGIEMIVMTLFWWHPVVWWIRHQIHIAEELCCDAAAASGSEERSRVYAESLLATLDFISESTWRRTRVSLSTGIGTIPVIELRLRDIMARTALRRTGFGGRVTVLVFGMVLLPVQPWFVRSNPLMASSASISSHPLRVATPSDSLGVSQKVASSLSLADSDLAVTSLPTTPMGWWNQELSDRWARVQSRGSNSPQLWISAGRRIQLADSRSKWIFDLTDQQLTAAAFWQSGSRLITGDAKGQVRLWDVQSGEPVSLLGCHASAVTSLAINENGLLVTGGKDGAVMAWDIQSGAVKAVWTAEKIPIQSVRISPNGLQIFVVADDWQSNSTPARIICLDSNTLGIVYQFSGPSSVATVQVTASEMIFADWEGSLIRINSFGLFEQFGRVSKEAVSAAAFSQDVLLVDQHLIEPSFHN